MQHITVKLIVYLQQRKGKNNAHIHKRKTRYTQIKTKTKLTHPHRVNWCK